VSYTTPELEGDYPLLAAHHCLFTMFTAIRQNRNCISNSWVHGKMFWPV